MSVLPMHKNQQRTQFFILGAPKCGTTSLAHWLEMHPQVFVSPVKEPHYFSTDLGNRHIRSESAYRRLFRDATLEHLSVGEASTWYLFSQDAVPNIRCRNPEALLIVMTRNPVEMARSLHYHNLRVLHEDESDFARAWDLQEVRQMGRNVPLNCTEPAFLQYGAACSLGAQVSRLLQHATVDQVLHIALEEMRADPARHYRRVLSFLGLPDDKRQSFPIANPARGHRSRTLQKALRIGSHLRRALGMQRGFGLARLNEQPKPKPPIDPVLRAELNAYFAADQDLLSALLTRLTDSKRTN